MSNWFTEELVEKGEVPFEEIEEMADSGKFHEWNFEAFDYQESGYEDVVDELKKFKAVDYLTLDEKRKNAEEAGNTVEAEGYRQQMEKMVDDVLKIYRSKNIFPIQYFSELGVMDEIEKCIAYKAKFDGNTVSCVSGDTEYFNGKEWKRIDKYEEGDLVLQYNPNGTGEFVKPIRYIHYQSSEPFYSLIEREDIHGMTEKLTGNHRVYYFDYRNNPRVHTVEELFDIDDEMPFEYHEVWIPTGCIVEGDLTMSEKELKRAFSCVAYQHTGNMNSLVRKKGSDIVFTDECCRLTLECRKYLLGLFGIYEQQYLFKPIEIDSLEAVKSINNFLMLTYKDLAISLFGDKTELDSSNSFITQREAYRKSYEKDKYCFTVPSGMLVLRRKGNVFITGNCGAGIGTGLCRWLFPNLFDTPSAHDLTKKDAETQYKKFLNDEYLKRAIKFCYSYKDGCPTPTSVEGGLRLVGSAPSNFRPMNAKAVYERFCPKGGTIYDFCCVQGDTEYFNGEEWKAIRDYKEGDKVLQYNEDGTAELVDPIEYIHYKSKDPFYEYVNNDFASCLTGNHDVVYYDCEGIHKIKQSEILNGFDGRIPISVQYGDKCTKFSEKEIIVLATDLIYISMEDHYYEKLKELRKTIYNLPFYDKVRFLGQIFKTGDCFYTKNTDVAELIVELCHMANSYATCNLYTSDIMVVTRSTNGKLSSKYYVDQNVGFKVVEDEDKYCFVVPSHMLVLKYFGRIYVTGNCGFGGRMLGALSSKNNYKYVGTDPCTETMYHLHQLGDYIEMVTGREDSYELHCLGSEDFRGPANSIDFAFSSPPYFNLEVYSDEPTQCYNKFPKLEDWLEGYVRETIKNIYHMLKPGHFYAVNIADFKVGGGGEVAYVDEWKRISAEEGMPLFDTVYLGVTARAGSAEQAAGELKKENIMIFKKPL